jgi:hypothetical protein
LIELILSHPAVSSFKLGEVGVCNGPIPETIQLRIRELKKHDLLLWADKRSRLFGVAMRAGALAVQRDRIVEVQINSWTPVRASGQIELAAKTDRQKYPYFCQMMNSFVFSDSAVNWLESHRQAMSDIFMLPVCSNYMGGDY